MSIDLPKSEVIPLINSAIQPVQPDEITKIVYIKEKSDPNLVNKIISGVGSVGGCLCIAAGATTIIASCVVGMIEPDTDTTAGIIAGIAVTALGYCITIPCSIAAVIYSKE